MKAVTLDAFDTPPRLRDDLPAPTPAAHEVLVRVHYSSINPADNSIAAGMLKQMGVEYEFPVILGRDYAGVVEQVGPEVTGYDVGDEVFGFLLHANPTVRDGSWAELIAVPQDMFVAPALPEDEAYLRGLGVGELLPRDGDLAAAARERHPDGFDAVLDLVNYAPDVPATLVKD